MRDGELGQEGATGGSILPTTKKRQKQPRMQQHEQYLKSIHGPIIFIQENETSKNWAFTNSKLPTTKNHEQHLKPNHQLDYLL